MEFRFLKYNSEVAKFILRINGGVGVSRGNILKKSYSLLNMCPDKQWARTQEMSVCLHVVNAHRNAAGNSFTDKQSTLPPHSNDSILGCDDPLLGVLQYLCATHNFLLSCLLP